MAIRNVTLVGANGNLGTVMLDVLVASELFRVTVLKRSSSKSAPAHADKIRIVEMTDGFKVDELAELLKGEDAVIATFPLRDVGQHIRLAEGAAIAGVKRFIPADFGSCDSSDARARELVKLFERKVQVRDALQRLAGEHEGFSWTSLVGGHFFDWGLRENFLHFNLPERKADIIDDGDKKSSQSTLKRYGEATVQVFQREDVTKNKMLFIQSFCVSQNEVLHSLEKATGVKWTVNHIDSEKFIKEQKTLADAGDLQAIEELVFTLGAIDGNWEEKGNFAMDLLGLQNEGLDEVVQSVVAALS
ncbi:Isoflavone reductase [Pleurostoma richardsiae]|uniref:Isoflavone reductase n=1 Tax=Pleurostoma richardsiae TaxID=41990 RepID=A0AA38RT61_9PEZI|nr:Isoflavone reductase [Pleurostoma richardsiae]